MTCLFNIQKCLQEEFMQNRSMVKARAFRTTCADFTRVPLPNALLHVGIYLYSVEELKKLGQIAPTALSEEEGLEQLSWMQFGVRVSNVLWRDKNYTDLPITVRNVEDIPQHTEHDS